jgi:hypothetical protein
LASEPIISYPPFMMIDSHDSHWFLTLAVGYSSLDRMLLSHSFFLVSRR